APPSVRASSTARRRQARARGGRCAPGRSWGLLLVIAPRSGAGGLAQAAGEHVGDDVLGQQRQERGEPLALVEMRHVAPQANRLVDGALIAECLVDCLGEVAVGAKPAAALRRRRYGSCFCFRCESLLCLAMLTAAGDIPAGHNPGHSLDAESSAVATELPM